ncbi:kelch-like protein 10 [Zootermopsis nevadensis]|uniref:Kelch-like protein diablo n=1 Tax=Zootermopsis nevadensis TaxID=136037 RepID=A0A067R0D9_ZOONE|nr:kelch-like protein 10 [Zootermopsis nevadensis]KDR16331.1 Kelch-like protein 10 [Zootermopsis nevadensis]
MESNQNRTETFVPLTVLREKNLLCDAVLRLEDGGVFPVRRLILSTFSAYFRALFTTTLHTSEKTDILLHGVSSDMMAHILNYVYSRKMDIHSENVRQLLVTADYLCLQDVTELCCDFLKDAMDAVNCIDIMHFARLYFIADLETSARRFVLRYFVEVSQKSEELLELPVEELQAIIGTEELNVTDERVVWECILRWINHDPDNRKGHIADLLKGVRLGRLDAKFFKDELSNHPYVTENEACRPLISETLTFLHDVEMMTKGERKEFVTPKIAYPRIPLDILFAIGGRSNTRDTDLIEAYDVRADRWSVVEGVDSIGTRSDYGTAVVGFDIYVIGGSDGSEGLNSCRCFNAVTKTCREVSPMHERRLGLSVAVLRGAVYAMGGSGGKSVKHRTAERYDCKKNKWWWIDSMNTERSDASAAVLNDKIYVAGGVTDLYSYLTSVEVYDPDTDQWTFVASMFSERKNFSCVAFHGCLYALGGKNSSWELNTEKYDPVEDKWTVIHAMNFNSYNLNAEVIDDTIFVIGGFCRGKADFSVKRYNDKEDKWHQVTNMNISRLLMSTCVVKNLPNARDYSYKHRDKLMEEDRK